MRCYRRAELAVQHLGDRQHHIEADEVGERQWAHRVIATKLHVLIDFFGGGGPDQSEAAH